MSEDRPKKKTGRFVKGKKEKEKEIEKLEKQLTKELCPKGKTECEPAYCAFRYTETCPFLKEWRRMSKEFR